MLNMSSTIEFLKSSKGKVEYFLEPVLFPESSRPTNEIVFSKNLVRFIGVGLFKYVPSQNVGFCLCSLTLRN
jgi:hypothetical protein